MHALRFDRPAPDTQTTRVVEVPIPEPGPGQVAIDVHYAGLNFADVMVRRGDSIHGVVFPFVPGLEAAGLVRAVGAGVDGLAPGLPVTAFTTLGGLAEVALAPAALTVPVPDGLDLAAAAAAPGALTTAVLLVDEVARVRPGETVVVHSAAGGVGQALGRLARRRGAARIVGVVGDRSRVEAARAAGFDVVLVREPGLAERLLAADGDRRADVVFDPQGTALLDTDLQIAAPGARIVLFGNASGESPQALPALGQLMAGNVSIAGFSISSLAATAPDRLAEAIGNTLRLLADGSLTVDLRIVEGLAAAAAAQQDLAEGRGGGKIVVRMAGDAA